ncbi:MAG: hypothetical protein Q7S10_02745 [bacterium]|nr:hypothetical protein [bacterium]
MVLFASLLVVVGVFIPSAASANLFSDILYAIAYIPLRMIMLVILAMISIPVLFFTWVFRELAIQSFALFEYVLTQLIKDPQNTWAITKNSGLGAVFLVSWDIVKNWANMLIVLGFIAIAVATILRFREYEAKKLLVPIIIVALLVNFSGVFIGLMIDGSNIAMRSLLVGGGQEKNIILAVNGAHNNVANPLFTRAWANATSISTIELSTVIAEGLKYAAAGTIFMIMYFAIACVFFLMALLLIQRFIMLAILFILSPLAFVFYVFPGAPKKQFEVWWTHFIKWCFVGLIAAFFIKLSSQVIQSPINDWSTNPGDNAISVLPRIMMQLIIAMGFLVAGYKLARKSSPIATMALDATKSLGATVMSGGLNLAPKILHGVAKVAAASGIPVVSQAGRAVTAVGDSISNWKAKFKEKTGLALRGYAADEQNQRQTKRMAAYDTAASKNSLKDKLARADGSARGIQGYEKAANIKSIVEAGAAHLLGKTTKERADKIKYAEGFYGTANSEANRTMWSKAKTKDADLAIHDEYGMEELTMKNPKNIGETDAVYETRVRGLAKRDAFYRMDKKDIKEKNDIDLVKLAEEETAEGAAALEEAIKRNIMHKVKGDVTADIGDLLAKAKNNYGSSAVKSAKKSDWRYAEFDQEAVKDIMTKINPATGANFLEPAARKQAKINEIKKLDAGKIRADLPDSAIDFELLDNLDARIIGKLNEREGLSIEKKDKLRSLIPAIDAAIIAAAPGGIAVNPARHAELLAKRAQIVIVIS